MKTYRIALLAVVFSFVLTGGALAMMGQGKVNLSSDQQALIDKAHDDYAAATADLKKQLFAKESALNAELYGGKADAHKIDALVAEITAVNAKLYAEKVRMQKVMAEAGILPESGHGMMGGGCPMMSGGMKHGAKAGHAGPQGQADASDASGEGRDAAGGHSGHGSAKQ